MLDLSMAASRKDRISFYSGNKGAIAIRNQNGEITIEFEKEDAFSSKRIIEALFMIFGIPSLVKVLVLILLVKNKVIGVVWYLIPAFFYLFLAVKSIIMVRKIGGKELLKNHAAEHKVFSAYLKLKRIPTVEEASRFSRFNKSCEITIYSAFITSQIIGFVVYICTSCYIIPEILLFLAAIYCRTDFPFNFLGLVAQFFTTSKPERHNIELAIAALSALEQNIDKF